MREEEVPESEKSDIEHASKMYADEHWLVNRDTCDHRYILDYIDDMLEPYGLEILLIWYNQDPLFKVVPKNLLIATKYLVKNGVPIT
jgi:hypothetical protein